MGRRQRLRRYPYCLLQVKSSQGPEWPGYQATVFCTLCTRVIETVRASSESVVREIASPVAREHYQETHGGAL